MHKPEATPSSKGRLIGLGTLLTLGLLGFLEPVRAGGIQAQRGAGDLGTRVNGGDRCTAGLCGVTGGTAAGRNLFHRFSAFDTRGGITGVRIDNGGFPSVLVGVTNPLGTYIDKLVSLSAPGNLYWLSPGGIQVSGAGSFANVQQLNLSTATGVRVGSGLFDAVGTTALQAAQLTGLPQSGFGAFVTSADTLGGLGLSRNGDLVIDGGLLTVGQELLLDAQGGHLLLGGARLQAAGGRITASGAEVTLDGAVLDVSAADADAVGGTVVVRSDGITMLKGNTQVLADGRRGGAIDVLGDRVGLQDSTLLQANGPEGGGSIRVGGDYLGQNPAVQNAQVTVVGPDAQIFANATANGDGGRVITWADDTTRMLGRIEARGGPEGGDGGFIETSGKRVLEIGAIAPSASSAKGKPGTWLLDPENIDIVSDPSASCFVDTCLAVETIRQALSGEGDPFGTGTNVAIVTDSSGAGTGNIQWNATMLVETPSGGASLSLDALGQISINREIRADPSGGPLNLSLKAVGDINIGSGVSTNGGSFSTESVSGGFETFGVNGSGGSLETQGGNIAIKAFDRVGIENLINSGGGDIDLYQVDSSGNGIAIFDEVSSFGGNITMVAGQSIRTIGNESNFFSGIGAGVGDILLWSSNGFIDVDLRTGGKLAAQANSSIFIRQDTINNLIIGEVTSSRPAFFGELLLRVPGIIAGEDFDISSAGVIRLRDSIELRSGSSSSLRPGFGASRIVIDEGADVAIVDLDSQGQTTNIFGTLENNGSLRIEQGRLRLECIDCIHQNFGLIEIKPETVFEILDPSGSSSLQMLAGSRLSGGGTLLGSGSSPVALQQDAGSVISPGAGDGGDFQERCHSWAATQAA
jgi:hypothetical protein